MRLATLGGAPVAAGLAEHQRARLPGARLHNEYGPTEATVTCVCHLVPQTPRRVVPIGTPTDGTTAHDLDGR
ncbi:AMP-binding protein [Nocardia wallacei]|uniref:AMP-binding protein n=1 Tax=Nocardia wallacei TaxID=480035 RepID=UPI00245745D3|nr:AMP-binding protein [Nocardia wallacei]